MGIVGGIVGVNGAKTRAHVISLRGTFKGERNRNKMRTLCERGFPLMPTTTGGSSCSFDMLPILLTNC